MRGWCSAFVCVALAAACGSGGSQSDEGDGSQSSGETSGSASGQSSSGSPSGPTGETQPDDTSGDESDSTGTIDPPAGGCFAAGEVPPTVGSNGFAMPSLEDERAAYEAAGWTWDPAAEPSVPAEPSYAVSDPDIHGDTEGDDLWSYLMAYKRTGEPGYLDRAAAWARYFKEDYAACVGDGNYNFCYDRDAFGADHLYGWGLIAWAEEMDDPDALDAAIGIGVVLEELHGPNSPFGCLPSNGCIHYGTRQIGRHLIFTTRLAEATDDARWEALRDQIIDHLLTADEWDDGYGMYFSGEWSTDQSLGEGAWAAGARITSPFQIGVVSEGLDHAYRATGNEQIRDRMVAMAAFVDEYGLDETYQYVGSSFGIVDGQPYHNYAANDPVDFWDSVYTTALVNVLVRGFRYTCDVKYLERARYFFHRGNGGVYGDPAERTVPDDVVHHFVDSNFASAHGDFYLDNNKGELQYTYLLFAPVQ